MDSIKLLQDLKSFKQSVPSLNQTPLPYHFSSSGMVLMLVKVFNFQ